MIECLDQKQGLQQLECVLLDLLVATKFHIGDSFGCVYEYQLYHLLSEHKLTVFPFAVSNTLVHQQMFTDRRFTQKQNT